MYTIVVAGIILFPWTLVAVAFFGWLFQRLRRSADCRLDERRAQLRKVA